MLTYPLARSGASEEDLSRLDALAAQILKACDGASSAGEIAERLELPAEQVWSALDRLADLGLLAGRASPPAGLPTLSRRAALGLVRGVALGAGVAAMALPAAAAEESGAKLAAHEERRKTPAELATAREQEHKRHESALRSTEQQKKHSAEALRANEERGKKAQEQKSK